MVHKLTSTTYLMMPFLQKRSFDQKFSLCNLTENNYSSPGFNYLYYQIITPSKICRNFFLKYKIRLLDNSYPGIIQKKVPKINIFGHFSPYSRHDARCLKLVRRAQRARKQRWGSGGRSKGGAPLRKILGVLDALSQLIIT